MTAPNTTTPALPSLAARAVPFLCIFCVALIVCALIQSRRAANAVDDTAAAKKALALVTDSLKDAKKEVVVALHVRDSLSQKAAALEKPAAIEEQHTIAAQSSTTAEIAAGEKLLQDSLATLAEVRTQLHRTDSIGTMLVAQVTRERFIKDSLHTADLLVMHQDTVTIQKMQDALDLGVRQHDEDVRVLTDVEKKQHGVFYRIGTGLLATGGGALCGAGGFLIAGPAGAVVGAGGCAALVSGIR